MPGTVQSIERAAAILRTLAGGPGRLGLTEIARTLDLAKGTTHGILRTLQLVGFVEQDRVSGQYQLGGALLHLGTSYLDINELRSRSINWADPLAARSGEAVRIGTVLEGRVLVVHHVFRPDDTFQTLDVGALLPLLTITLASEATRVWVTVASVTVSLAITGFVSARLGESDVRRAVLRNVVGGLLAMAVTHLIGQLVGARL